MSAPRKLSAVLIVLNEEVTLPRCLNSLVWCDEIIIIDGGSTDGTKSTALNPDANWSKKIKWFERTWDGFRNQRNFALDQAENDWILCVDADEECSRPLEERLKLLLASENPHPFWKIRRQEYFLGKEIHYGVWNPSYQDRFFKKQGVRFVNEIHEYAKYPGISERIHEPLNHSPDFNPEKFLSKMNKYTSIEARDRVNSGQRTNWFHIVFAGPAMFLKNYFYYKSYRDGMHGVVISILEGISRSVRHIKIWRYQNETKTSPS